MKSREELEILLLQIRDNEKVRLEELNSFVSFADVDPKQVSVLNVFDTPAFEPHTVEDYDVVIVGGASEASVLEPDKYPFVPYCVELLKYCLKIKKPVFASCFGFQLAVLALDGDIVRDYENFETGSLPITLTEHAKSDHLFVDTPNPFYAVSVHRERASSLPEACVLLAYTEKCPHAFKVKGAPFWAFQFHPEVDKKILLERLGVFREQYTQDIDHFNRITSEAQETPHSNALVAKFIDIFVDKQN